MHFQRKSGEKANEEKHEDGSNSKIHSFDDSTREKYLRCERRFPLKPVTPLSPLQDFTVTGNKQERRQFRVLAFMALNITDESRRP
ncbi:hypothetical protein EAH_00029180 [Eimeria acervulina]|uniref:Uncharacterized protein n=1 Tax=Eimeria acervulina TaxID=5801 RepID=U6GTI7_EIMAC|nr:hypothetical protein EAH_00029180 [Eimeria acervulina]CDI82583.1 hypothetical protein EAH_00029180 [Eimeria acervulina]